MLLKSESEIEAEEGIEASDALDGDKVDHEELADSLDDNIQAVQTQILLQLKPLLS